MDVKWTKKALNSLAEIAKYIEKDNPLRAGTFVKEIREKTNTLGEFPGIGRPGRVPGTRELVVHKNYIVPYRVRGENVEIIRVHHAGKRWPKVFD
jgi:toxin ParE1/3/4